jgi:hypothetical protein
MSTSMKPPLTLVASSADVQPHTPETMATHLVREACRAAWQDGYDAAEHTHYRAGWYSGFSSGCVAIGLAFCIVCLAFYTAWAPA